MRYLVLVVVLGCGSDHTATSDAASDAAVSSSGQQISLFDGPLNAADNDYSHFMTILAAPTNHAYLTGVTTSLPLGCVGACTGGNATYLDHGTTCPKPVFDGADGIDALLTTIASAGYINNLILSGASYVNNSSTPMYLGSHAWADTLAFDCLTPDPSLTWAPSQLYLPGDYIKVGANFWQMTASCPNNHDVRCTSGGGAIPGCLTTPSSPCSDGTAQWTETTDGHAPPLDYWCDANTTGINQFDCFQLKINGLASITNHVATITVTGTPTFPINQTVTVTGSGLYDCASCKVTMTSPTQIVYSGVPTLSDPQETLSAGVISGAHSVNINTAPAAVVVHQLPIPYEQPMRRWREYLMTKIHEHYAATGAPAIGYIRMGLTKGGETDTSSINAWPFGSQDQMLTYEQELYTLMGKSGCGDTFTCIANLHTYPTQEAAYINANNLGFDNNALGVAQVTAIGAGNCMTPGGVPNSGDWCLNFAQYPTLPNGKTPNMTLQTGGRTQYSSPGVCAANDVGAMSVDTACGYPGNLPIARANGATNIEMYFCDVMLAMDPDYSSNHCMFKFDQATYEPLYQAAFAAFLH